MRNEVPKAMIDMVFNPYVVYNKVSGPWEPGYSTVSRLPESGKADGRRSTEGSNNCCSYSLVVLLALVGHASIQACIKVDSV